MTEFADVARLPERDRERLLVEIGELAKVGGWEVNLEAGTVYWSDMVYHIHELEPGTPVTLEEGINFYAPEARELVAAFVQAAAEYGTPWKFQLPLITAKGNRIWVESQGKVEQRNGQSVRLYGAIQNVTEHHALETDLREDLKVMRKLHAITARDDLSLEEKIPAILQLGCERLGLPLGILSRIEGDQYEVRYAVSPDDSLQPGMRFDLGVTYCSHTLMAEGPCYFHHAGESHIGNHPCYQNFALEAYIGTPVLVGGHRYGTINFSSPAVREPFSEREIELLKLLAQWVGNQIGLRDYAERLDAARRAAEAASQAKSAFLASMSHELRTPLNAIIGFSHRLTQHLGKTLEPRWLDAVETIERNGRHLLALINDVLDIARIEAGKMTLNLQPVPLAQVTDDLRSRLEPLATRKGLALDFPLDVEHVVLADPLRLNQILANLVDNAIKYTNSGRVWFTAEAVTDDGQAMVEVGIHDTGLGISEEEQRQLFQIFYRAASADRSTQPGSGLGLALVTELTQLHGGSIRVESAAGEGSHFFVRLPAAG